MEIFFSYSEEIIHRLVDIWLVDINITQKLNNIVRI